MHSDVSQEINNYLEPLKDNFTNIDLVPKVIKNNALFMRKALEIYRQSFPENTQAKDMCHPIYATYVCSQVDQDFYIHHPDLYYQMRCYGFLGFNALSEDLKKELNIIKYEFLISGSRVFDWIRDLDLQIEKQLMTDSNWLISLGNLISEHLDINSAQFEEYRALINLSNLIEVQNHFRNLYPEYVDRERYYHALNNMQDNVELRHYAPESVQNKPEFKKVCYLVGIGYLRDSLIGSAISLGIAAVGVLILSQLITLPMFSMVVGAFVATTGILASGLFANHVYHSMTLDKNEVIKKALSGFNSQYI